MDRQRAKELLPIIQAFADGEEIEYEYGLGWVGLTDVLDLSVYATETNEYRIKPKPREFWVHDYFEEQLAAESRNLEAYAILDIDDVDKSCRKLWVKVREVL